MERDRRRQTIILAAAAAIVLGCTHLFAPAPLSADPRGDRRRNLRALSPVLDPRTIAEKPTGAALPADGAVPANAGPWSAEEHDLFLQGLAAHGPSLWAWRKISRDFVPTRSKYQVRDHWRDYHNRRDDPDTLPRDVPADNPRASDPRSVAPEDNGYPDFERQFLAVAQSHTPVTDKVTHHAYQVMYGQFLLPFYLRNPAMKMLEIGLGCNMGHVGKYKPGASVAVWKELFPRAELWEAEYDGACVEKSLAQGELEGVHPLVGDQNDVATLDGWIEQSGGANFDVVIDDGGHQQCQIWTSFQKLWPRLQPGGLYFIEDLHVSRQERMNQVSSELCPQGLNVVDMLKDMQEDLTHGRDSAVEGKGPVVYRWPDVKFVYCQRESCVVGKRELE